MKQPENTQVRVRFAPSPTGHLHLGGLRAALFNWLFARKHKGSFLVRIEDTDIERSKPEYTESILQSLEWADIKTDEPIVIQSQRLSEHKRIINNMLLAGTAYKCYCTPQVLEQRLGASAAHEGSYTKYDQKCRLSPDISASEHTPFAVRFKIPDGLESVSFNDLIRGHVVFSADQLDDFIIMRSDGTPMYNFVVVADDAYMGITHVLRGEEHLGNTPKQLLLYQACNFTAPEFGHLPLILGPSGNKLSKRDAAVAVLDYKNNGFLPDALCNYLARLGWSHGDQEIFTRQELINYFSLSEIGKKGAIFDSKKLEWMNGLYIRTYTAQQLVAYIEQTIDSNFTQRLHNWTQEYIYTAIDLYKERVKTLKELIQEIELLYTGPTVIAQKELAPWLNIITQERITQLQELLDKQQDFSVEALSQVIKNFCTSVQVPLPEIAKPLRVALLGKSTSPGIFEVLALLGKRETNQRLHNFAARLIQGE